MDEQVRRGENMNRRVVRSIAVMTVKLPSARLGLATLLGMLILFPNLAEASGPLAYITNSNDNTVSVIATASNTVTATVPVGLNPQGLAVTSDGAHVYVGNSSDNTVSVIITASNTVTTTVPVGAVPFGVAVTPDGAQVYVGNSGDNTVSVIATASNTVTATVPVGAAPFGVVVTPDGVHVYVANFVDNTVSVIATVSNTVTATVLVGVNPFGLAVTPDGAWVYVAIGSGNTVSVIATAGNTVTATVPVGNSPVAFGQFIGIVRVTVPFASLTSGVEIERAHSLTRHANDSFEVEGRGVLGQASDGIAPNADDVTLSLGSFSITIPAGSFVVTIDRDRDNDRRDWDRDDRDRDDRDDVVTTYHFEGVIGDVSLNATIVQGPERRFRFEFEGRHANLSLVVNPVIVGLAIGHDVGHVAVKADIDR
jgi:YVTN family beta-propeller protein